MATSSTTYEINLKVVGGDVVGTITQHIEKMTNSTKKATKSFGDCFKSLLSVSLAAEGLGVLEDGLKNVIAPGAALNSNMLELSAISGVTGESLKAIEQAARNTAKTFGTDASANVESYKMILSQLSPEIANNAEAMRMMGENINILSKQMGGDTVAATEVLNTSLNQFGVSMDDPIAAAKVMADMMNVMSAAAQKGSAELPQIKQALEQVGLVAKTTGLSFAETNAYIQLLDQAGKKGSEGGVALRNVLTTLSEGRFTSKLAAEGLQQAGISVDYLADSSVPLHERLITLRKIQGDTALMTKVFGKENMAAAIAMINSAEQAQAMSVAIVGTNSATEQAQVIMGGFNEKMNRTKAWIEDLKISFFNITESVLPFTQGIFTTISTLGQVAISLNALSSVLGTLKLKLLWATISTKAMTVAQTVLNAVMYANPIGLIIGAMVLLIGYITVAIRYFDSFGSSMLLLLGPIGMLISAFMMIKRHWDSIVEAFKSDGIIAGLKRIGLVLLDVLMHPLQRVLGWVGELTGWDWAKNAEGSVTEFRQKMDLISEDEKAHNEKNISQESESAQNDKPQEVILADEHKSIFDVSKANIIPKETLGKDMANKVITTNKEHLGASDSANKVRNLSINKLIENLNIYNQNGTTMSKESIVNMIREALLTATADFTLDEL